MSSTNLHYRAQVSERDSFCTTDAYTWSWYGIISSIDVIVVGKSPIFLSSLTWNVFSLRISRASIVNKRSHGQSYLASHNVHPLHPSVHNRSSSFIFPLHSSRSVDWKSCHYFDGSKGAVLLIFTTNFSDFINLFCDSSNLVIQWKDFRKAGCFFWNICNF